MIATAKSVDATESETLRPHAITAVLATAVIAFSLLQSLIIPVLPVLQNSFGTDQSTVSWVVTAYLLSASVATPLLGRAGDRFGKRRVLVITITGLAVGSVMSALAPSVEWLIAARVVQGIGGGVLPLSFSILRDVFSLERTRRAVSFIAAIASIGFGVGIVVAGPIVEFLGFRWLFWIPAVATVVSLIGALIFIPEAEGRGGRINPVPAVFLGVTLASTLLVVSRGADWGWGSSTSIGLGVLGLTSGVAWLMTEMRVENPLVDLRMMRRRGVWTANAVGLAFGYSSFSFFAYLPQLLQTPRDSGYGFGMSVTEAGWLVLPSSALSVLTGLCAARLVRLTSARAVIVWGAGMTAIAYSMIALAHDHVWEIVVAISFQGVGTGLIVSTIAAVVITSVPAHQTGTASGMNANIRTIGGSMGTAAFAGLLSASVGQHGLPAESAYAMGFVMLAVSMAAAAVVGLWIPRGSKREVDSAMDDAVSNAELGMLPNGAVRRSG
ncbi:MFS transporter [Gordonia terrae]|uniref:MFS transporter n=1 Tax=Gordonia terrae TaxID=2055 RepID=UPI003F6C8BA8